MLLTEFVHSLEQSAADSWLPLAHSMSANSVTIQTKKPCRFESVKCILSPSDPIDVLFMLSSAVGVSSPDGQGNETEHGDPTVGGGAVAGIVIVASAALLAGVAITGELSASTLNQSVR